MELSTFELSRPARVEINWADLFALLEITTQSPPIYAAFEHLDRFIKVSDIELSPPPPPEILKLHNDYHVPFINNVNRLFKTWGFCPYIITKVKVDMSNNEKWMENYRIIHGKNAKPDKSSVPVLVVPSPGTYRVYVELDENSRRETIECVAVKLSAGTARLPKIHVLYSHLIPRPRWIDGKIQSPIQTLLVPFRNLCLSESLKLSAQFANAYPTVILQHKDLNADGNALPRSMVEELYGESEFNPNGPAYKYEKRSERETALSNDIKKFSQKVRTNLDERMKYFNDPLSSLNPRVELKRPIETSTVTLIDGLEVSKSNPLPAIAPLDSEAVNRQFIEYICHVFGIPISFYSREHAVGSGYADNDLKELNKTIKATQSDLEHVLVDMIPLLDLEGYHFKFHAQTFIDFEMLMKMYELEAINKPGLRIELEDAYSLPRSHRGLGQKRSKNL